MSTEWMSRAACRTQDPELFFPGGTKGSALKKLRQAIGVCAQCPVQSSCLEFAFRTGQEFGVWGGTSEEQRRAVQRRKPPTRTKYKSA